MNILNTTLSPENLFTVTCCCVHPDAGRIAEINSMLSEKLNWDSILKLASLHGLSGLIYNCIKQCQNKKLVPHDILEEFKNKYRKTAYKNLIFINEYNNITADFNSKNIKILPLKGIAFLKELYHNIGLRSLSDIDILVKKKDLNLAEKTLQEMGYTKKKYPARKIKRHFHSIFWRKKGSFTVSVELHWDIDFSDSPFRININDLWSRAEPAADGNIVFYRFSLEDRLIFNSFHIMRANSFCDIMMLKNFCDLSEIISMHSDKINWEAIKERSEQYGVTRPVFLVFLLLKTLFQAPVSEHLINQMEVPENMVLTIISERIFLQNTDKPSLPKLFVGLTDENSFIIRLRLVSRLPD